MTIRRHIRTTLAAVDRRLGLREWLARDGGANGATRPRALTSDPYTSAPELLAHPRPNTVIDIGGNVGQFAEEIFRAHPGVRLYSFEPIPECYEQLVLMREREPSLVPVQLALSDRDGEAEFHLSRYRGSSSIQEMRPEHVEAWPFTEIESKITVRVARLDAVAAELELEPPILAKLDIQGHELAAIRGGRETLARCQRVVVECNFAPLYEGQPSFTEIYEELRALGFLFDGFMGHLRHPQAHELLSADAVFFKPAA
ncbi:MAG TPA: FkbM family methyltransferase [Pyrinomonadaceae bacterium]|nr:FkbM family methyltransferase [Pyrinomonadaceae bacterium]